MLAQEIIKNGVVSSLEPVAGDSENYSGIRIFGGTIETTDELSFQ
jgi:hypothetical protein